LNNGCDSALKHYSLMDRCTHASALGYVGLATDDPKIEQYDVCCTVGTEHNWANYFLCSDSLVAQMRPYLFLAELPAPAQSSGVAKSAEKSGDKIAVPIVKKTAASAAEKMPGKIAAKAATKIAVGP
jgi:hypothetical protein